MRTVHEPAMDARSHIGKMERAGAWLGRVLRSSMRREARLKRSMIDVGIPSSVANAALWGVKLIAVALLAYVALWLALLLLIGAIWVSAAGRASEQVKWSITQRGDHRKNSFYDPNAYTDDPDPRWDQD